MCDFTCEWVLLPVGDIYKYKYKYNFSSETQKLPEFGCVRFRIRFKNNFHTLNADIFLLHKNIIFGHIFDDLMGSPAGGKSDICCVCFVSKVKLSSSPPKK